ncbi:MAG: hypothetical protein ACPGC0_04685, partial [Opitutales bacterium]
LTLIPALVSAQQTYSFLDKGSIYDNKTSVQETIGALTISATSSGGVFNSNKSNFGIVDTTINGTAEIVTLSFSQTVEITLIDFSRIGSDVADGAKISTTTTPALSLDLHTGVPGFNGNNDIYTPATPIRLEPGESITFTGSSDSSGFELHRIQYNVIPEMSAQSLGTGAAALTLVILSRLLQ